MYRSIYYRPHPGIADNFQQRVVMLECAFTSVSGHTGLALRMSRINRLYDRPESRYIPFIRLLMSGRRVLFLEGKRSSVHNIV